MGVMQILITDIRILFYQTDLKCRLKCGLMRIRIFELKDCQSLSIISSIYAEYSQGMEGIKYKEAFGINSNLDFRTELFKIPFSPHSKCTYAIIIFIKLTQ